MSREISGFEDVSDDPYQLSIIVKDTKNFTSLEIMKALSEAIVDFVPVRQDAAERGENWIEWLNGRFRKIVKRLKPSQFDKLSEQLANDDVEHFVFENGNVSVIVLSPQHKSFQPSYLKRAQLSGLTTVKEDIIQSWDKTKSTVLINQSADMSVSKMLVSSSHAVQMAKQFVYDSENLSTDDFNISEFDFVLLNIDETIAYDVEIVDAGLTEVASGTMTAAVMFKNS